MDTNTFIEKSEKLYNKRYDYALTNYVHSKIKVIIICPIHGKFEKRPTLHLQGQGCPVCKIKTVPDTNRYTTDTFVKDANIKHNFKYTYAKTKYIHNQTKIIITCKEHGDFEQKPLEHLIRKVGCKKCAKCYSYTTNEFIEKASKIHSNRYEYSKSVYSTTMRKLIITCKVHGDFNQTPNEHLAGRGCKQCANLKNGFTKDKFIETAKAGGYNAATLYILKCSNEHEEFYKIGITLQTISKRYSGKKMPYNYEIIQEIKDIPENIWEAEKQLHLVNKEFHYIPSIKFGGSLKECFSKIK